MVTVKIFLVDGNDPGGLWVYSSCSLPLCKHLAITGKTQYDTKRIIGH